MKINDKIYVAGHRGLVGSALVRRLKAEGHHNIIIRPHAELDLTQQEAVARFFHDEKPEYVFLAAAKVGGIYANDTYPADFIYQNIMIETNIIHMAHQNGVKKLLFLGSSCIYPKHASQPMKEESLLTGPLEPTNEAYSIAKIAGIKLCTHYNNQYRTNFISVMPTNMYGPGDNYHLEDSHVVAALIRKMHEAKTRRDKTVTIWGTGSPKREFLYSDDLADACVFLMKNYGAEDIGEFINIGTGKDITIGEFAKLVSEVVGYKGDFIFDNNKPDGTPQKLLDISKINKLGWQAKISLRDGLKMAYEAYGKTLMTKESTR